MDQDEALQTTDEELVETQETEAPESVQGEEENKDPAGFTKRINQKHFELMEKERERAALEAEVIALKAKIPEIQKPVVPPLPDPYDDDFDIKMSQRDEAIKRVAAYEVQEEINHARLQEDNRLRQEGLNKSLVESVNTYSDRAKALNISANELKVAGQTVAAYGVHDSVAEFILQDDKGPAITAHLARNPEMLETISKMNPIHAALYIENNVKPKLSGKTELPEPAETLGGGGVSKRERGPKGAKYE